MLGRSFACLATAALLATAATSTTARAAAPVTTAGSDPVGAPDEQAAPAARKRVLPYRAVETQAIAMTRMLPRPGFGLDAAFVFGWEALQARIGAIGIGMLPFALAHGEIGNVIAAGTADVCAARSVTQHQIRMCVGGQGGAMLHQWKGYERPGRKSTPFAAGTLKADYRLGLTDHFGVIAGVGIVIPVVGPSFRAYDKYGSPTPVVFPGPVAGFLSVGTSIRW